MVNNKVGRQTTMSELSTVRDAMRVFGVSRLTIYRWVQSGKIRALKMPNGRWLFRPSDLGSFEAMAVESTKLYKKGK